MIHIHLSDLIFLFLAFGLGVVCTLWFYTFIRERRRETHRRHVAIQCRMCSAAYTRSLSDKNEATICPVCQTPNVRGRLRPI